MSINIKDMAVKAGFCEAWVEAEASPPNHPAPVELLEKFAQLVAEDCAKVCDTTPPQPFRPSIEAAHAIRARYSKEVRCAECNYQHGHAIGCVKNPVDIALSRLASPPGDK